MTTDIELATRSEEWLAIGLDCTPADRLTAEAGVLAAYAAAGLPAPEAILWLGSPHAGALAAGMLVSGLPDGPDHVRAALAAQGWPPGAFQPGRSVRAKVRTAPWARARARRLAELGGVGFARHWAATARRPWQQLADQIPPRETRRGRTRRAMSSRGTGQQTAEGAKVAAASREALLDAIYGQQDAAWLASFDETDAELTGLAMVARSAGWWWAYERVAILTERPAAVHRDNLGRLHHGDGAALAYPDGFGLHAWRGMPIPAEVAAELPSLTVERIRDEGNAEVRRVMLEHFGFDRYLRESGAQQSQRDECGILWRVELPGDEPLVMVEVVNATPEPDGTSRTYFLRVPPQTRTAREGVAWTFDLTAENYAPLLQT
jgi:hypothetical protein